MSSSSRDARLRLRNESRKQQKLLPREYRTKLRQLCEITQTDPKTFARSTKGGDPKVTCDREKIRYSNGPLPNLLKKIVGSGSFAAEHHRKASEHHAHAARHGEAAKHHEAGHHEKAAYHAHTARAHAIHARGHAEEATVAQSEEHGKK